MDPEEIKTLWRTAGDPPPAVASGPGLLGLDRVDDPGALAGTAVAVLGMPAGAWGDGPAAVRTASAKYAAWVAAVPDGRRRAVDYGDVDVVEEDLSLTFVNAHHRLADILAAGALPLVLGGDAVVSLPVLQVLSGKLRGVLGVVAFTPTYDIASEPVYAASSRWARALELGVVSPANLVLVGGSSAPPEARARRVLDGLGVSTYSVGDVARDGLSIVAQEALEVAATGTEAVYLSVDLGVLEGVADPVGLTAREVVAGAAVVATSLLAAADICGRDPGRGGGDGPAVVAARVAAEIVAGVSRRIV
jgi:arginase family enzyme